MVDWLHKKHNLFLCVDIFKVSASDTSGYRYTWSTADLETEKWVEDETILGYLTPEEAWDKCIEESLKQI